MNNSALPDGLDQFAERFTFDGKQVRVTTNAHPDRDVIAVRIESERLDPSRLAVRVAFPVHTSVSG